MRRAGCPPNAARGPSAGSSPIVARGCRALRVRVADAQARLEVLQYRDERAELREQLRRDQAYLAYWEQMAPLHAADMCSECGQPAWHTPGTTYSIEGLYEISGPCPAWPRWAQGRQAVHEAMRQARQHPLADPPLPPKPIAVLAPGVPIEEVIAQLTTIQASHPGAQVRQGKGHRWEIWPAPTPPEPAEPADPDGSHRGSHPSERLPLKPY
jgi:hypothetical protein